MTVRRTLALVFGAGLVAFLMLTGAQRALAVDASASPSAEVSVSASVSASASSTPSASTSASPSASASTSTSTAPTGTAHPSSTPGVAAEALPLTGVDTPMLMAAGGALVLAGLLLAVVLGRRRKVRFTA